MSKRTQLPVSADLGLLLLRLVVGFTFCFHGTQKLLGWFDGPGIEGAATLFEQHGIPYPTFSVILASLAELLGGLALITGIAARALSVPLVITMLTAAFVVHGSAFSLQKQGMEYTLVLAACAATIGLAGPGRFAFGLDRGKKGDRR